MIAKEIIFEGRVQGVGFRYTVKDIARGFDVCGTVQNLDDGSVRLYLIGDGNEVDQMIREIVEESNVAHHIRNTIIRDAAIDQACHQFKIIR